VRVYRRRQHASSFNSALHHQRDVTLATRDVVGDVTEASRDVTGDATAADDVTVMLNDDVLRRVLSLLNMRDMTRCQRGMIHCLIDIDSTQVIGHFSVAISRPILSK